MRFCLCFESELTQIGLPLTSDLLSELVLHTLYGTITDQIQHPDDKTFNRVLTIHGDLVNPTSEAEEIELLYQF